MSLQPDGIYLRKWDKDAVAELGGVEVDIPEGQWHDLKVELKGTSVTVKLDLDGATGVEAIDGTTSIPSGGDVGLGVGALAEFRFKGIETDKPVAGGVDLRYHYDAAGRVVGRTVDPGGVDEQSQYFIYDDDRIMLELDGTTGAVVAEWVYGTYIDEIVAMYRDTDPGQSGFETHYYIQDDLFNVVALTDASGAVIERYTYDDYGAPSFYDEDGEVIPENESQYGNFFLFNGRRWDEVLELYDYRTRYYDPKIGRFLRIDTIGPWGDNNNLGNPYAYVGSNPWTYLDPWGRFGYYPGHEKDDEGARQMVSGAWNNLSPETQNRVTGTVGVVGGGLEIVGGGFLIVGGSPTGVGPVAGTVMTIHGADTVQAGFWQVWTGERVRTSTAEAITYVTGSETAGDIGDAAIGMIDVGVSAPFLIAKISGRAGTVNRTLELADYRSYRLNSANPNAQQFPALSQRNLP